MTLEISEKPATHMISEVLISFFMFDNVSKFVRQDFRAGQSYCSKEQKRAKASVECCVG